MICLQPGVKIWNVLVRIALVFCLGITVPVSAQDLLLEPSMEIVGIDEESGLVTIQGDVPEGFRHIVLEESLNGGIGDWSAMVSGALSGARATVVMRCPFVPNRSFFRVKVGTETEVPAAVMTGPESLSVIYDDAGEFINSMFEVGHVLNRIAYGPSVQDYVSASTQGVTEYIKQQLAPETIDESDNDRLNDAVDALFYNYVPNSGTVLLSEGASCKYFKGTEAPPVDWNDKDFDDSDGTKWLNGTTGIGYGDEDDATVLEDMRGNYNSIFVRIPFEIVDPLQIENLLLRIRYDDSYVAYLNGIEISRQNITGNPPAFNQFSDDGGGNVDDDDLDFEFDVSDLGKGALVAGTNVLAVQVHNATLNSSDLSLIPEFVDVPDAPYLAPKGKDALQQLLHIRGIYSKRQLQAVLGEFWENHFTTDYDKVEEYLEDIDEYREAASASDSDEDRIEFQVRSEAARIEWEEYEFFYQNALGNFGDMLLYSATSPAMLIYLDNVLNLKDAPNENYAREILELFGFGVDNRYTQSDIEQLSKAFTGWTVRKVPADAKLPFPQSARTPPTGPEREIETETALLDVGENWSYFKGTAEPSPEAGTGNPTTAWTEPGFVEDGNWATGGSSIGYGDDDDSTVLDDMRNNYFSVYLRKQLVIPDPDLGGELLLDVAYDDGYVLYLNGTEIKRSYTMRETGSPPAFDTPAIDGHEVTGSHDTIRLGDFRNLINIDQMNTLAVQVHNTTISSSDLSIIPRIVEQTLTPESIDITDPAGLWTFRFNPDEHDTGPKTLFQGTPYEMQIPEGREGIDGLLDAIDVIDAMVTHPSTSEFICIKLINKFVSDGISLDTYHDRTAPDHLLGLVDNAIHAWNSSSPPGDIGAVMNTILDPTFKASPFWSDGAYLTKVKTPIEYINSTVRALDAEIVDNDFKYRMRDQAMSFFDRDEPDGYPEKSVAWVDTLSLLERMKFCQATTENRSQSATFFDADAFMANNNLQTIEDVLDYFDIFIFQGNLMEDRRAVLRDFANTDDNGELSPFNALTNANTRRQRIEDMLALMLSSPECQYQ